MKINVFDVKGNKAKEINSSAFDSVIREDIVQKITEIERLSERQPYAPYLWAGMETSASGNVKHNRHVWKTDRGKGMGRFPKKRMSDKGDRFVWIGAVVPGTRGGRRAHPPKILRKGWKINKKEKVLGFKSALAMTASAEMLKKRYNKINSGLFEIKIKLPLVIEDKILNTKTKEFFTAINNILGSELFSLAIQNREVRAGIGKMRGRKYKKNAGMLLITADNQNKKISGIEVKTIKQLKIKDMIENGARICIFTESAVKELENKTNSGGKG